MKQLLNISNNCIFGNKTILVKMCIIKKTVARIELDLREKIFFSTPPSVESTSDKYMWFSVTFVLIQPVLAKQ